MLQHSGRRAPLAVVMAVVVLAACSDDDPTSPDPHAEPVEAEVYDRETGDTLAFVHGDHWDGTIVVGVGEEIEVDVGFLDAEGELIPLGGDITVGVRLDDGEPDDVIAFATHGDHLDFEGVAEGETHIVLQFLHDGQMEWETPPLRVVVGESEEEPVGAEVYDRESGELLADVHDDHWDGSIELAVGDELELDVVFLDEHGDEIPLSGDHTLGIRFADGEPDDVIAFESHGDHADIEAQAEGETAIVLELVHDDHVEWETPALPVNVGS